jgi:uncharacterized Zn-binding protein involved in type VI secretion
MWGIGLSSNEPESGRQNAEVPEAPPNPAIALQQGIGSAMETAFSPVEAVNLAVGESTNAISQMLPSFPAATLGCLAIGIPHAHTHPPSLVPVPVIGPVVLGCSVQVLINSLPAARVGDIGFNPTCGGLFPMFEIFTGSSKVFIGGMRAARMLDVTMHCWPAKEWMARGAIKGLVVAAKAAMIATLVAGTTAQVAGIVGEAWEASEADSAAMAEANALAAGMSAAQLAADAAALAAGMMMGKDPCVGAPVGAVTLGHPNVLIGGFPMPSGLQIAGRHLEGGKVRKRKSKVGEEAEAGPTSCPIGS